MSLLIEFIATVVGAFTFIYMVIAAGSLLVGFIQFLLELPDALQQDIDRWRATHSPPRMIRHVRNEAGDGTGASRPRRELPPHEHWTP